MSILTTDQLEFLEKVEASDIWMHVNVPMLALELQDVMDRTVISGEALASTLLTIGGELKAIMLEHDPEIDTPLGQAVAELGTHFAVCSAIVTRELRGKDPA